MTELKTETKEIKEEDSEDANRVILYNQLTKQIYTIERALHGLKKVLPEV